MKLSTRGHYGMHAMMDLGLHYGKGVVLLRDLCEVHGFSEKYLEQLLRLLRQAGLVESVRGAKGGFWLSRPPDQITALEIIEALEGDFGQTPGGCRRDCVRQNRCTILETWGTAIQSLRLSLARVTLARMIAFPEGLDRKASEVPVP